MSGGRDILVIKLGALGDFIQALGPMAAIRRHHAGDRITLLTTAPYAELARASGYADRVWSGGRPGRLDVAGWLCLRHRLCSGFARVYDLQNNGRTSLYFRLMRPRPEWVGVAPGASHRNDSPERTAGTAFSGHVQTLALAGITDVHVDDLAWMTASPDGFNLRNPYVLLVPGCSPGKTEKRWPAARYGMLARLLAGRGVQPVILGTAPERTLAAEICALCPEALDLTGRTGLFQLAALARGAAGAVGNDTGPMHLIGPTGCPCVVLFSAAGDPARHAPLGPAVTTLFEPALSMLDPDRVATALRLRIDAP